MDADLILKSSVWMLTFDNMLSMFYMLHFQCAHRHDFCNWEHDNWH